MRRALFKGGSRLWSRLLVALTLAAFVQQGCLTQTHIHFAASQNVQVAGTQAAHGKSQPSDDPSRCPICQELLVAGAYVTPAPIAFAPPVFAVLPALLPAPRLPLVEAASHDWQSRGPPQG